MSGTKDEQRSARSKFRAKTPPASGTDIFEPGRFRDFVEVLDACMDLVEAKSRVKVRIALVTLDNLAEILMSHRCRMMLDHDGFSRIFFEQKYSDKDREDVRRDFLGKVRLLEREKVISKEQASVLRVGHSFRNAGFHDDQHNDEANAAIVRLLFQTACEVFALSYGRDEVWSGHVSGGSDEVARWLKENGINKPYLEYGPAAHHFSRQFTSAVSISREALANALADDLVKRFQKLILAALSEFPVPPHIMDEILKTEEFEQVFDEEAVSRRFWEMRRNLTNEKIFNRDEYAQEEQAVTVRIRSAYDQFKPTVNWRGLVELHPQIESVKRQKTPAKVLTRYEQLNDALAKGEHLLQAAIRRSEAAAEWASYVARGK